MVKKSTTPEIKNTFVSALDKSVTRRAEQIATKMDMLVKKAQKTFFAVLAGKIIGATSAPSLGQYTPNWKPLTKSYQDYRLKRRGVARSKFYEFNSRKNPQGKATLKDLLASAKAETAFGTPLARKGRSGRRNAVVVYPFPKVTDNLRSGEIDEKNYLKGRNRGIAWRLRNFQGSRLRPILQPFMLWWLDVKMKQLIREAVK